MVSYENTILIFLPSWASSPFSILQGQFWFLLLMYWYYWPNLCPSFKEPSQLPLRPPDYLQQVLDRWLANWAVIFFLSGLLKLLTQVAISIVLTVISTDMSFNVPMLSLTPSNLCLGTLYFWGLSPPHPPPAVGSYHLAGEYYNSRIPPGSPTFQGHIFFFFFFLKTLLVVVVDHFKSLYWICYNIASVFIFYFFGPQGMWNLSSLTRDQTCTLCTGRWCLNRWTTREGHQDHFLISAFID